ncbi:MAG: CPBP family intramembrane metalloprotease [Oscillospiraceae bacterium]|nr:CPBP family intramembrane metalloprotease [Oscillospiraceae bacterium]
MNDNRDAWGNPLPPPPPPYQPPPPSKGRLIWRAALPPLLHLVIQIAVMFVGLIAALVPHMVDAFWAGVNEGATEFVPDEDFIESILPQVTMTTLIFSASISILLFYFMYKRGKSQFDLKPLHAPGIMPLAAFIGLAGNFAVLSVITAGQDILGTDLPTSTLDDIIEHINPVLLILTVCVIVPIAEELCFRGLAFNRLKRVFPFWTANVLQALVFGLIHGTPIQIGYAFIFGLLLGWATHRTGRLSVAVLMHITFNSAFIPLGFVPGIEELMQNPGGLLLMIFLPSIAVTLFLVRRLDAVTSREKIEL